MVLCRIYFVNETSVRHPRALLALRRTPRRFGRAFCGQTGSEGIDANMCNSAVFTLSLRILQVVPAPTTSSWTQAAHTMDDVTDSAKMSS